MKFLDKIKTDIRAGIFDAFYEKLGELTPEQRARVYEETEQIIAVRRADRNLDREEW